MKNNLIILLVLGMSILFSACPYSSEVALDTKPNIAVNSALLGTWELRSDSDYEYVITPKDGFQYSITKKAKTAGLAEGSYTAFFSKVGEFTFLNLSDNDADPKVYYFYRFTDQGNGRFTLESVTDNIDEKFTSSSELRAFFGQHAKTSFFYYSEPEEYIKTK